MSALILIVYWAQRLRSEALLTDIQIHGQILDFHGFLLITPKILILAKSMIRSHALIKMLLFVRINLDMPAMLKNRL